MANVDDLKVTLSLDGANFMITAQQAGKVVRSLSAQLNQLNRSVGSIDHAVNGAAAGFRRFVITLGAVRFILMDIQDVFLSLPGAIIRASGEVERMTKLMEGLSNQATESGRKLDALRGRDFVFNTALRAPFEVKAIQDAFVKFKSAGLDPTNGSLQALIDSVAKFGGSSESLKRASIAIQQMAGKGVISMEELRQQLGESVPTAMRMMAAGMNMTMQDMVKAISKGTVIATPALEKMFAVMRLQNAGAARDLMQTWNGLIEQMKTRWTLLANDMGESGFLKAAKDGAEAINKLLADPAVRSEAIAFGRLLGNLTTSLANLVTWAIKNTDAIKALAAAFGLLLVAPKILSTLNSFYEALAGKARTAITASEQDQRKRQVQIATDLRNESNRVAQKKALAVKEVSDALIKNRQLEEQERAHAARMATLDQQMVAASLARKQRAALLRSTGAAAANVQELALQRAAAREALQVTQQQIAANAALAASARKTAIELANKQAKLIGAANAAQSLATKFSLLTGLVAGWRFVWAALGGWIGAITIALTFAIPAWIAWGNKGKEAIEKVRDAANNKLSTREDEATFRKDLQSKQEQLARLNQQIARQAQVITEKAEQGLPTDALQRTLYKMVSDRAALQKEIQSQSQELIKIAEIAAKNETAAISAALSDESAALYRTFQSNRRQSAEKYLEEAKKVGENTKKGAALIQQGVQEMRKADDDMVAALEQKKNEAKADFDLVNEKGADPAVLNRARARYDAALEQLNSFRDIQQRTKATLDRPNEFSADTKAAKKSSIERFIEAQSQRYESAKMDMARISDDVVDIFDLWEQSKTYVDAMIEEGKLSGPKGAKPTYSERLEAIEKLFSAEKIEIAKKGATTLRNALQSTSAELEKAQENYSAASNVVGSQESVTQKMLKKLEPFSRIIREELEKTGKSYEEFVTQVSSQAARADALNFAAKLVEDTRKLKDAVILDDRDRKRNEYADDIKRETTIANHKIEELRRTATADQTNAEEIQKTQDDLANWITARYKKLVFDTRPEIVKLADEWSNLTQRMEDATAGWVSGFVDMWVDGLERGKFAFKDFAVTILKEITKLMMQKVVSNFIMSFAGMFGSGSGGGIGSAYGFDTTQFNNGDMNALGGISGPGGKLALSKYARGGVVPPRTPHVAIFGEGSQREAYVPLPDGRRIPVAMEGGGMPNVQVNVINQTGVQADAQTSTRMDAGQMVLDVILTGVNKPGPFRDSMRQALR